MTPAFGSRPAVVVKVDDIDTAFNALDWAGAEAAARDRPLKIVHITSCLATADSPSTTLVAAEHTRRTIADRVLEEALAHVRDQMPDLYASVDLRVEPQIRAMLDVTKDAELLVLENCCTEGFRHCGDRPACARVITGSACPVVIVGSLLAAEPGPSATRVVVGIDGSEPSINALGYAFQAAAQRGIGLTALYAWAPASSARVKSAADVDATEAIANRLLGHVLKDWAKVFPDVPVATKVVRTVASEALIVESAGAALTVVGSRGNGTSSRLVLGSVCRTLLCHASCPVAILD